MTRFDIDAACTTRWAGASMAEKVGRRRPADHPMPDAPARGVWYFGYIVALFALFAITVAVEATDLADVVRTAPAGLWVLVALAIVADLPRVSIQRPGAAPPVFTSVTFCYAISYGWGQGSARTTQAAAILVASGIAGRRLWPSVYDVGRYGLALAAASAVASLAGRPTPFGPGPAALLGILVAAAAWYLTFRLLTATGTWLYKGGSWSRALQRDVPVEAISAAALLLLSPMLLLVAQAGVWLIPLVLAPIFAVSQMAQLYARQTQRATQDPLTELPNRLALTEAVMLPIQQHVDRTAEVGIAALFVVDITQLRRVNQALGHRVGDDVVVQSAHRLAGEVGPRTTLARLQSDEFAVFVWALADADEALARAKALRALFDPPMMINNQPVSTSVSIGIALCPADGTTLDALERRASTAMARAKDLPQPIAFFQPDEDAPSQDQISLLSDLHRALEEPGGGQIVPFYQPQVNTATGAVTGVEALLRWRHPDRGMVSPEELVLVAEYSPLMQKVTMTMLEQVLAQLAAWRAEGWDVNASVNVSVRDLHDDNLVRWLDRRLRHHGVAPSLLQLELTESAVTSHYLTVLESVQRLRRIGVGASLDDFGTGFSSLQHLRQLPLTEIKIDRSFIQSMMESPRDETIVRAVIDLGRGLGLRVVAEGVENDQTRLRLLSAGCHLAQGWFYAAPMPADDFAVWYSQHTTGTGPPTEPTAASVG